MPGSTDRTESVSNLIRPMGANTLDNCIDNFSDEMEATHNEQDEESEPEDLDQIKNHSSYDQVMLDVNRCAGRLQHLKQAYSHCVHDDSDAYEPVQDLTHELELIESENRSGEAIVDEDSHLEGNGSKENCDKNVSTISEPTEDTVDSESQNILKERLANLIVKLLIDNPKLHYYQGFHDVCLTYMTLLGHKNAFEKLRKLVDTHFKLFMQPTMNETQDFLALVPIIVGLHDTRCQMFLETSEVGTIFALSWVITWFSHVISNEQDVKKIFLFLEDKDPHLVLYLSAQIVLYKKNELLELEPEMSTVHHFLSQIPRKERLPIDDLLVDSLKSIKKWPPEVVEMELSEQRRRKLEVQNRNVISSMAHRYFGPILGGIVPTDAKTAIIVLVLASALAFQFDKWFR